jgi:hypothetical protein
MGVLLALAQADLSYKPHERSSTAGQIISTIIKGLEIRNDLAAKRHADVAPRSAASYKVLIDFGNEVEPVGTTTVEGTGAASLWRAGGP